MSWPNGSTSHWTEEMITALKRMWADEGYPASRIANEIGGVTRNAVLGKLHRLGMLAPAVKRVKFNNNPLGFNQKKKRAKPSPPVFPRVKRLKVDLMPRPEPPQPGMILRGPVLFIKRPLDRCAFIPGDPKAGPITELYCCGESVHKAGPYCQFHRNICRQPQPMSVRAATWVSERVAA